MKLVSFELDGEIGYGAVAREGIVRLDGEADSPPDLKSFIAAHHHSGWPALRSNGDVAVDAVRLLPPIPDAGKILCVATNFREADAEGNPVPEFPLVFTRFADSLTGHLADLIMPDVTDRYDFEGELAVVIGKRGHRISRESALDYVAGYSCFQDGSVRDWQKHSTQFTPGKNFLCSGSMGPWIVTKDEIEDFNSIELETSVNGVVKQSISMGRMIFDVAWLISYLSTFTPLSPGDVIATGTPKGFGSSRVPPEFLSPGDTIEVKLSQIGSLKNKVVRA